MTLVLSVLQRYEIYERPLMKYDDDEAERKTCWEKGIPRDRRQPDDFVTIGFADIFDFMNYGDHFKCLGGNI